MMFLFLLPCQALRFDFFIHIVQGFMLDKLVEAHLPKFLSTQPLARRNKGKWQHQRIFHEVCDIKYQRAAPRLAMHERKAMRDTSTQRAEAARP